MSEGLKAVVWEWIRTKTGCFGCGYTVRVIFCRRASTLGVHSIMFRELELGS